MEKDYMHIEDALQELLDYYENSWDFKTLSTNEQLNILENDSLFGSDGIIFGNEYYEFYVDCFKILGDMICHTDLNYKEFIDYKNQLRHVNYGKVRYIEYEFTTVFENILYKMMLLEKENKTNTDEYIDLDFKYNELRYRLIVVYNDILKRLFEKNDLKWNHN